MRMIQYVTLLLFAILFNASCASFKDRQQTSALSFPQLGSIIKTDGALWFNTTKEVGMPLWEVPQRVTVQQLPFNKKSYMTYANYMANASKINSIAYRDSLPYKPKYIRLQIGDRIEMTHILNSEANKNILEYLEHDEDYKLVVQMDVAVPEPLMPFLENADNVLLKQDSYGKVELVLINDTKEETIAFETLQVFDFDYATFCWGEDRYHHKRIENLVSKGKSCPKGTFVKPTKVKAEKGYLKF